MRHIVKLLHRFRKDEEGAFALVFGVVAIVLIAMGGAAVDFTSIEQARTRTQTALDAAALALQPSIYNTGVTALTIQPLAQKLVTDQLADGATTWTNCTVSNNKPPCATVVTPVVNTLTGTLTLTANLQIPMNFVSLVGVTQLPSQIVSVATRKKLNLEVAMVLDNSGSMAYTMGYNYTVSPNPSNLPDRMTVLKCAATSATYILFYGVSGCDATAQAAIAGKTADPNTKMGIVPFTEAVNVGTSNGTAAFGMDLTGAASITTNNFDNDDNDNGGTTAATVDTFTGPINRISVMAGISGAGGWGGCVEARKSPYDTDDTPPTGGDTLFTPYFAPDEPDTGGSFSNNYTSDTPAACNKVGACTETTATPVTFNNVSTIVVVTATKTVTTKKGAVTTSTVTTTTTTGPVAGSTTSGTTTQSGNPTITTTSGDTRSAAGVCSCTGQTITSTNSSNGTATTNGSVRKTTPANTTIPADPATTTDGSGTTTKIHNTKATTETDTQPMKYTTTTTNTCQAPYAPWAVGASGSSANSGLSPREMQERLCKYTGATMTSAPVRANVYGPNGDCPATAISPLSATPGDTITAVNAMSAVGGTNITEGAAWGVRVLSPGLPFNQGRAYDSATSKVLIVMTDGENTIYPGTNMNYDTYYSAYGYPWNNRLGVVSSTDTTLEAVMNSRLSTVCTNAKNLDMTVYTIGVDTADTTNPTATKALLSGCATPTGSDGVVHYYFPNTAADLTAAFQAIASQLADLRLAQ